jgi:menaquinone-dependent protoporphyrinogen oxidase
MTVLVSAASKHGATAEIASALAEGITRRGVIAEVRDPAEVADVTGYDAVVLGSAVYMGHWLGEAKELVSRVGADLRDRPVWLFSSGPIGEPLKPEEEAVDVAGQVEQTGAVEHRTFAGRLDRSSLGFGERAVVRALRAPEGDFRDWAAIDAWAETIASSLSASRTGA